MPLVERFTHREILRLLGVTPRQLAYWEKLGFAQPRQDEGAKFYAFNDLISLRAVKRLTEDGVTARRLHRAVEALQKRLGEAPLPLTELRLQASGRDIFVEHEGAQLEPLSGQFLLDFEAREPEVKVAELPERTVEELFALAVQAEADAELREQAVEAYRLVIERRPDWLEPHMNLGMLLYEKSQLPEAARCFRRVVELDPENSLARFNLGTVLEGMRELRSAREQFREAIRLKPDYADAHYNLALVAEKLRLEDEAREHWARYLELDPSSPWADCARDRLNARPVTRFPSPQPRSK